MNVKGSIVRRSKPLKVMTVGLAVTMLVGMVGPVAGATNSSSNRKFDRIAHFPVFENSNQSEQTIAEIIDVSRDGKTLIYSDAALGAIGFIDIRNPERPEPKGTFDVNGDPTSVAVAADTHWSASTPAPTSILRAVNWRLLT